MYYIFNGKLLKDNETVDNSPLSDGAMYGYGLFETIKIKNYKPLFLDEHLERLKKGLNNLGIILLFSNEKIKRYIKLLIDKNKCNGALKIAVVKNKNVSDLIILMKKSNYHYRDYKKGYSLKISDVLRNSTSNIVRYKTINYLENILELKKAKEKEFDEVIFFNEKGFLCEGAISNIFVLVNSKLYTPSIENGLLNGIMRQKIISLCEDVVECNMSKEFLKDADEIFITNSLMEVMPVHRIDDINYKSSDFRVANRLRELIRKED